MMVDHTRKTCILGSTKKNAAVLASAALGKEILLPRTIEAKNIKFVESHCGRSKQSKQRILIAYASKYGSTSEVAVAIGKVLCHEGHIAETKKIKNVTNLQMYDAVIVGSAIQYDTWMSEARAFVTANQHILNKLPVAFFFTCLVLSKKSEKTEQKAMVYSDKLLSLIPQVKPLSIGRFAGVLDYSRIPFFPRQIIKTALLVLGVREGDYRDWNAIRSWGMSIHRTLVCEENASKVHL
jgi:menaquinone-dependent protoporphyrinogen oxidase